jgi:hypothetical protein
MMKTSLVLASLVLGRIVEAFVATSPLHATSSTSLKGQASTELGLPCEDDCAIAKYPNLPASVHPGVLSGQAQIDLLRHAKENGELKNIGENAKCSCPSFLIYILDDGWLPPVGSAFVWDGWMGGSASYYQSGRKKERKTRVMDQSIGTADRWWIGPPVG